MQAKTQWPNVILGLCGIGTSAWAVQVHRLIAAGDPSGCDISATISCDAVMGSKWAVLFGIPVGFYGMLFFSIVIIAAIATKTTKATARQFALQNLGLATIGFASSVAFMFISHFLLQKTCVVCMSTHATTTLLIIFSILAYLRARKMS